MRKTLMIFLALVLVCGCGAAFAAQDNQQAAHLRRLTDMQDELKALRAQYRGRKEHV